MCANAHDPTKPGGTPEEGENPTAPKASTDPNKPEKTEGAEAEPLAFAPPENPPAEKPKQRRGFAAMDRAKVRAIAMLGGAAVHRKGTAHRFSHEEAREAGRKGGLAPHRVRGRKLPAQENNAEAPAEGKKEG
ncbi:General stress protein [Labilithrix luteola]|uniref:General stress protein n=1 Tax=Labilithrix luteola TaxID=1391654 RepID=A0A0K1PZD8_9BACT|nr:KGG domain-containing protein [Labilithrix luteola]AKU98900.1 General stress protein [Labilithrix luteola]